MGGGTPACSFGPQVIKAAGAKGLHAGEEARARAAQAEAEGLRVSVCFCLGRERYMHNEHVSPSGACDVPILNLSSLFES